MIFYVIFWWSFILNFCVIFLCSCILNFFVVLLLSIIRTFWSIFRSSSSTTCCRSIFILFGSISWQWFSWRVSYSNYFTDLFGEREKWIGQIEIMKYVKLNDKSKKLFTKKYYYVCACSPPPPSTWPRHSPRGTRRPLGPADTVQYSIVQYSTVKKCTIQYSTVQYSTVQCSTIQYLRTLLASGGRVSTATHWTIGFWHWNSGNY